MKKKLIMLVMGITMLITVGCAKEIKREVVIAEPKVVNAHYSAPYSTTTMIMAGKILIPQTIVHPADYDVTLEVEGRTLMVDNEHLYNLVKNKIGQNIKATIEKITYDDGEVSIQFKDYIDR